MLKDIIEPFVKIGYEILDTIFEFDEWGWIRYEYECRFV